MGEDECRDYMTSIIIQLRNCYPNSSFMVLNLMEGDRRIQILDILSQYNVKIVDYPRQYEGWPILPLETIHDFLRTSDNWLSSEGERDMLLLHCERHGWPVLAFMLASLLLYRQVYTSEERTLEMAYRQAPKELLRVDSPLNPHPSYLRYLQYVPKLHSVSDWPLKDSPFVLECLILRSIPNFDGKGGCRPMVRIHGKDPSTQKDRTSKILFSTPKVKKQLKYYGQAESTVILMNTNCNVQGDVVIECIHVDKDLERDELMLRFMFNTAFVQSNIMILSTDEIDIAWRGKDQFPEDFKIEVFFSELDTSESDSDASESAGDDNAVGSSSAETHEEFFDTEETATASFRTVESKPNTSTNRPQTETNPQDPKANSEANIYEVEKETDYSDTKTLSEEKLRGNVNDDRPKSDTYVVEKARSETTILNDTQNQAITKKSMPSSKKQSNIIAPIPVTAKRKIRKQETLIEQTKLSTKGSKIVPKSRSDEVSSPVKTPTHRRDRPRPPTSAPTPSSSVGSARSSTHPVPSPPIRALRTSKEVAPANGDRRSSPMRRSPPSDAASPRASSSSPSRRSGFAPSAPPPPRSKLSSGGALPSSPHVGRSAAPTRGGAPAPSSPRGGGGAPPREASSPRATAASGRLELREASRSFSIGSLNGPKGHHGPPRKGRDSGLLI
ncbi:Formin-like protein 20 [Ananas comosus]|uniref:Formin-like protein 20 n=1 Tax=Ananas comosus TaxID=4615 RepID=A0A199VT25_ANACO|nr:Formin-like protein 20 [Ananas comosus]